MIIGRQAEWKVGASGGCVVTSHARLARDEPRDLAYYGGYLVCESIGSKVEANLIASAPDLYRACESLLCAIATLGPGTTLGLLPERVRIAVETATKAMDKANGRSQP